MKSNWIVSMILLMVFVTLETIIALKFIIKADMLQKENEALLKVIEMKDSMMADLQESNTDLQKKLEE